jgi:Kef-type K+ transport system membrane component KefB
MSSIPYEIPNTPSLLTLSSFLYLINVADSLSNECIHAGLIGPLVVGIVYGSQGADILSSSLQSTLISLGYIGLLLIVFEAGLSTNVSLLYDNLYLSLVAAMTGILLPIALSLILLHFGYGYAPLQAFAAGAALCSTSLGTTLALLDHSLRQTKVGSVLMSAALIDDIAGLVIAAIISQLSSSGTAHIPWQTIVRPILVSFAFALCTPLLAWLLRWVVLRMQDTPSPIAGGAQRHIYTGPVQLFLIVGVLSGFVAGAQYAGTSELFGAYLAGLLLTYIFGFLSLQKQRDLELNAPINTEMRTSSKDDAHTKQIYNPQSAFEKYIVSALNTIFSPVFFASIGSALPIRSLGSINGSNKVVWRGLLYSLLMVVAKLAVGIWIFFWPDRRLQAGRYRKQNRQPRNRGAPSSSPNRQADISLEAVPSDRQTEPSPTTCTSAVQQTTESSSHSALSRTRSALLLGVAMVARGEIALIVAQLARPLLVPTNSENGATSSMQSEPFAVVVWAILVSTVGGAVGVGLVLRTSRAAGVAKS